MAVNYKKQKIAKAISDILWMARRYADSRYTYAPGLFNDAYDVLRSEFGDQIDNNFAHNESKKPCYDIALPQSDRHPYALYGNQHPESEANKNLVNRKFYKPVEATKKI